MCIYLERQTIRKLSTLSEHSRPGEIVLTIELNFNAKSVTERTLPWGTAISWSKSPDRQAPKLTGKLSIFKETFDKAGEPTTQTSLVEVAD